MYELANLTGTFLALWIFSLVLHRRRLRQPGASLKRRMAASAVLVAAGMAPLVLAVLVDRLAPERAFRMENVAAITLISLLSALASLGGPRVQGAGRQELPPLADETVLARVRNLAALVGMRPPRVLLLASAGGELLNQAFACDLCTPALIVGDGVLHRLDPEERDAILAHELAHHSTGSIWALSLLPIAIACVTLTICGRAELSAVASIFLLLFVGARRVVGRHYEVACDLVAARAVGAARVAAALEKIHAGHLLPVDGLWARLAYASATHPMPALRREAIWQAADEASREQIERDLPRARSARRLTRLAAAAWLSCLGVAAWLAVPVPLAASMLALAAALAPLLLLRMAIRDVARVHRRRVRQRTTPGTVQLMAGLVLLAVGVLVFLDLPGGGDGPGLTLVLVACAAGATLLATGSLRVRRARTLTARISAAMRAHEFARAVEIAAEPGARKRLDRIPALDHDVALARHLAGDHEAAASELLRVARRRGAPPLAWLTLANVQLHRDPGAALATLEEAARALPGDAGVDLVRGRALIGLGRLEEAGAALERAATLRLQEPYVDAGRAEIALARGDLEGARALAHRAIAASPGAVYPLVALAAAEAAQLAAEAGEAADATAATRERAQRAAARALELARANPFALLLGAAEAIAARVAALAEQPPE